PRSESLHRFLLAMRSSAGTSEVKRRAGGHNLLILANCYFRYERQRQGSAIGVLTSKSKRRTTSGAVMKRAPFYALVALTLTLGVFAGCSKTPARTDSQITSDVQSKFYADPAIESRQIQVHAAGGVVTLNGSVSSESERAAAASDAATVAGVR